VRFEEFQKHVDSVKDLYEALGEGLVQIDGSQSSNQVN